MKVRKNLEGLFLVAAVLAALVSYATAAVPAHHAKPTIVADGQMHTVVVHAKRAS